MAFSILFILDVGNNVTMEPYRAYVNDRLNEDQRGFGFLSQSAFTGLAQCLAYASPFLLVTWFGVSKIAEPGRDPGLYTDSVFYRRSVVDHDDPLVDPARSGAATDTGASGRGSRHCQSLSALISQRSARHSAKCQVPCDPWRG